LSECYEKIDFYHVCHVHFSLLILLAPAWFLVDLVVAKSQFGSQFKKKSQFCSGAGLSFFTAPDPFSFLSLCKIHFSAQPPLARSGFSSVEFLSQHVFSFTGSAGQVMSFRPRRFHFGCIDLSSLQPGGSSCTVCHCHLESPADFLLLVFGKMSVRT
jgi:hypothetical protein